MPRISVHTAFKLNLGRAGIVPFAVGVHEVSEEVAAHHYVTPHASVLPEVEKAPSDPTAADQTEAKAEQATPNPDERAVLQERATALGIAIDKRWGVSRLQREIAAHEAAQAQ